MCNPRKVMILLTKRIEEQWRQLVRETRSCGREVEETAVMAVEVNLAAEMGELALEMFGRVLAGEFDGFPAWEEDGRGNRRRRLAGVTLVFQPATGRLQLEAAGSRLVRAAGTVEVEAAGTLAGDLAASGVGQYYDDGWHGRTRERAAATAAEQAARQLAAAEDSLRRHQQAETLFAATETAARQAERRAAAALEEKTAAARGELRRELREDVGRAGEQVFAELNRAVGEAYRQTLRQLVLSNGGRIITDERTGAVINMELELY